MFKRKARMIARARKNPTVAVVWIHAV